MLVPAFADARSDGCARRWEPIVVTGAKLASLLRVPESHFEALAIHSGRIEPIPFQIDERLPDGRFAMSHGPEPLADDSPGVFDEDDELAMMAKDMGDRVSDAATLPGGALEITAFDPLTGAARYAYIAAVTSPLQSSTRYVSYNPALHRVETDSYRMAFSNDFPNDLALQSHQFQHTRNLIDGAGVKVSAKVLMWFDFRITREDINNHLVAWTEGPIRIIRRQSHSVKLGFGIKSPQVESIEYFYDEYGDDPFTARVVSVPRFIFSNVQVRTWLNFVNLHNFTLAWAGMAGEPVEVGGPAAEQALASNPPPTNWMALTGEDKSIVQTFRPSPDLTVLNPRIYYCNDGSCGADEESSRTPISADGKGNVGIGYLMTGWQNLSAGTHHLDTLMIVLPSRCKIDEMLKEVKFPLVIAVNPIGKK